MSAPSGLFLWVWAWVWDRLYDGRLCSRRDGGWFLNFQGGSGCDLGVLALALAAVFGFWFLVLVAVFLRSVLWRGAFCKRAWYIL